MMLDYGHDGMMDWGSNGWFYMILGVSLFVIIAVILLYLLSRRTRQDNLTDISHQEAYNNEKSNKIETRNLQRITSDKGIEEKLKSENAYFCPNCGEKLDERTQKYCPFCGSEI